MMEDRCYINGEAMVPSDPSLYNCLAPCLMCSSDEPPPTAIPPSTPCVRCRRLESKTRAIVLSETHFPLTGIQKCCCGAIATMFSQASGRDSQDRRIIKHERSSLQQMAKWRNLPGVAHWGLHVVVPRASNSYDGLLSFFSFLSCPRVCLLDVSCLLGLTLRPSAPVCCCHRDSLTRGRLAFEQEAVRVSSSHSPRLVLHVMACAH